MKEAYFQPETIDQLAGRWVREFGVERQFLRAPFYLERAALLVLDMQEYFLDPDSHAFIPSGPLIIPQLNQAIREFRAAGRPVIATRHANTEADASRMGTWWAEVLMEDHPLGQIHPELELQPEEILIKSQYDAFYGSGLGGRLRDQAVSQLVIGGVMTHLCCETTARSAFVRGWEVFFLVDGTATYNREFHTASLRNLGHGFAVLTTVGKLLGGAT